MNANPEREERPEAGRVRIESSPPPGPQLEAATLDEWLVAAEACLLHSEKWHYGTARRCPEVVCAHDELEAYIDALAEQQFGGIVANRDTQLARRRELVRLLQRTIEKFPRNRRWVARCEQTIEHDGLSSAALWETMVDRIIESVNRRAEERSPTRRRPPEDPYRDTEPDLWELLVEKSVERENDDDAPDIEDVGTNSIGVGGVVATEILTPFYELLAECARRLVRRIDPWADPEERAGLRWYRLDPAEGLTTEREPRILQRASAQMTLARLISTDRWRDLMTADPDRLSTRLWSGLSEGPVDEAIRRLDPLIKDDPTSSSNPLEQQRVRTIRTVSLLLSQELKRMADTDDEQSANAWHLAEVFDRMVTMNVSKSRGKQ